MSQDSECVSPLQEQDMIRFMFHKITWLQCEGGSEEDKAGELRDLQRVILRVLRRDIEDIYCP